MDGRFKFPFFKTSIWVHKDQASLFSLNKEFFFILNVRLKSIVFGTQRNVVVVVYIIYIYLKTESLDNAILAF